MIPLDVSLRYSGERRPGQAQGEPHDLADVVARVRTPVRRERRDKHQAATTLRFRGLAHPDHRLGVRGIGDLDPQQPMGGQFRADRDEPAGGAAGFSQDRLGECVFCSGAYIGQIEAATRRPQLDLSQRMDAVLKTGGYLERLCRLVLRTTKHAEYFAHVAELMTQAAAICQFSAQILPGLLQTAAYARALIRATEPLLPEQRVEERVGARLERAELFNDPTMPQFWAILHESGLRMPVCDRAGMREQLTHLAEFAASRRIVLQVVPNSVGAHPLAGGAVTLMAFEDAPPAVYVEGPFSGHLLDTPAMVSEYQRAYDCARAVALSPEASLALIESVAEEYGPHEHNTGPEHGHLA